MLVKSYTRILLREKVTANIHTRYILVYNKVGNHGGSAGVVFMAD